MPSHEERPYAHHAHLPYARQPLKTFYVVQRVFTTLMMVPYWAICYSILPKTYRPRKSWSIRQIINVNFTRRIYKITEVAGVTWGTRDPQVEPLAGSLKETRFEWAAPLPGTLRSGVLLGDTPFTRVGCYVWSKEPPTKVGAYKDADEWDSGEWKLTDVSSLDEVMSEIYSIEYRLLQHASFPAQLQDAATVYAHVIKRYQNSDIGRCKIVLIGDSSGGNLVLALTRWVRDEGSLPMPDGLLLLSPSCDVSHALPETVSSYIPRPNAETDYLTDTPEPRALLQRTFLGFHSSCSDQAEEERLMLIADSEYVSPCSPRVLQEWSHPICPAGCDAVPYEILRASAKRNLKESPYRTSSKFQKLFENFPRTLVVVGDAERLVREVRCLLEAMHRDGVDVSAEWVEDAVHDVLIIGEGWWDAKVIQKAWQAIGDWAIEFQKD
ncbi:hypothetical protein DXG01_007341 [Tephrocybe rancida]|nr:hypothetical protein DXG01_007341 [Tephrocybe rancida]